MFILLMSQCQQYFNISELFIDGWKEFCFSSIQYGQQCVDLYGSVSCSGSIWAGFDQAMPFFCNIECIAKWKFNEMHLICGRLISENPKNIDLTNWISALVLFFCYFYCCFSINQKLITNQFTIHDEPIKRFHWKLIKGINYYLHNGYRTTFD